MANSTETATAPARKGVLTYMGSHLREYGMMLALLAIMIFFQIVTGGTLLKSVNITNLFLQNSYIIIMALGMLLVIVAGHIDLSVGSVAAFVGAVSAVLTLDAGLPVLLVLPICILVGMLIGAAQGYWIAYWRIPSFIVTLAGMLVFRGLTLWLLGGQNLGPFPKAFQALSTGFLPDLFGVGKPNLTAILLVAAAAAALIWQSLRARRRNAAYGLQQEPAAMFAFRNAIVAGALLFIGIQLAFFRGLPNVLLVMSVLILAYAFFTENTVPGRRIYAIGGNLKAARLSGINADRLTFLTFVNMGALAALAGMIVTARLNSATPKAGVGFELDVIAAVFIGGASMSGGVGKIVGVVVGAFIMGVMNNGMSIMGIGIDYQQVIKGLVLLAAVIFDVYNKSKQG